MNVLRAFYYQSQAYRRLGSVYPGYEGEGLEYPEIAQEMTNMAAREG
jgi:hypothetical protein